MSVSENSFDANGERVHINIVFHFEARKLRWPQTTLRRQRMINFDTPDFAKEIPKEAYSVFGWRFRFLILMERKQS